MLFTVIEQLPDVQKLSATEKFQLATELWDELSNDPEAIEPNPFVVQLLEQRYADYKAGLEGTSTWSEIKQRIGKS
jgi:putative addiction module component (TIGR02574 family)